MGYLQQIRAIILLPVIVTIVIPGILIYWTYTVYVGWSLPRPMNLIPIFIGLFLIIFGLILLIETITLFATTGKGTLAPWDPTQKLVIQGVYRFVRNPMITGVFSILLGETALSGSPYILIWFFLFFIVNLIYIPFFEEPDLIRRFGNDFIEYKKNVPRWIPRLIPWYGLNNSPRDPKDKSPEKH